MSTSARISVGFHDHVVYLYRWMDNKRSGFRGHEIRQSAPVSIALSDCVSMVFRPKVEFLLYDFMLSLSFAK